MKLRQIGLTALFTVGLFGAITYTSCTKDPCNNVTCDNGGACNNGNCSCPSGFIGSNCQTSVFVGTWSGTDVCTAASYDITVTIAPSSTTTNLLVTNPGGFGTNVVITGVLSSDGSTATFVNQDAGGGRVLNGIMSLTSGTTFAFQYSVSDVSGASDQCTGNYTLQ